MSYRQDIVGVYFLLARPVCRARAETEMMRKFMTFMYGDEHRTHTEVHYQMSIARYVQEIVDKFTAGRQAQLPQRRHRTAAAVTSPCHVETV